MIDTPYQNIYGAIAGITEITFPGHARSVRGNVAQLLFRAEAAARGLVPCSPAWNLPVDHILIDYFEQHRLVRVEIKQSQQERNGAYTVELRSSQGIGGTAGSKKGAERVHDYEKSVDVFAILLPKAACWYLIPIEVLAGKSNVSLRPDRSTGTYAKYKNAWSVLKSEEHELIKTKGNPAILKIREKYRLIKLSKAFPSKTRVNPANKAPSTTLRRQFKRAKVEN